MIYDILAVVSQVQLYASRLSLCIHMIEFIFTKIIKTATPIVNEYDN